MNSDRLIRGTDDIIGVNDSGSSRVSALGQAALFGSQPRNCWNESPRTQWIFDRTKRAIRSRRLREKLRCGNALATLGQFTHITGSDKMAISQSLVDPPSV